MSNQSFGSTHPMNNHICGTLHPSETLLRESFLGWVTKLISSQLHPSTRKAGDALASGTRPEQRKRDVPPKGTNSLACPMCGHAPCTQT